VIINASTAPIIYNKGASMLRMVEGHIGPERYQKGVRAYLNRHAYGCADSRDLWEAFESEAEIPVTAMVQNWIGQPGYPLVTARRHETALQLSQQRFTYLPQESRQSWQIPVKLVYWTRGGESREQALLFTEAATEITLPADLAAYKLNCGQTGFYRVAYEDAENLAALGQKVREGALPHMDRWGLQNDLFALVRAGRTLLNDYLAFLRWYEEEAQYLPLASIGGHLHYACAVVQGAARQKAAEIGGRVCRQVLARIGMRPAAQEPHTLAALRNQMLWQAATWDVPEAVAFGVEQFEAMMAGGALHPDIARSVMQVGAQEKGAAALQWFKQRFKQSPSEHERMNILVAMTSFRDWPLLEEALGFTLEAVPPRNQFIPIAAVAGNPTAAPRMWEWYRQHLDRLETFHPLLYERVITGVVPLAGLGHEAEVDAFFQSYLEQRPHLKDAVALTLEHLAINARLRAANSSGADDQTPL
jgi:aminopeptidase N